VMRVMCFVFLVFQIVWKLCAGTNKSHKIRYKIRLVPRSFLCDNWIWIPSCTEIAQCPGVITTCSLPCVRQIIPFDGSNCRGHRVASVKWMGALKLPRPPVLTEHTLLSLTDNIDTLNFQLDIWYQPSTH
jgi:hypothetical protein